MRARRRPPPRTRRAQPPPPFERLRTRRVRLLRPRWALKGGGPRPLKVGGGGGGGRHRFGCGAPLKKPARYDTSQGHATQVLTLSSHLEKMQCPNHCDHIYIMRIQMKRRVRVDCFVRTARQIAQPQPVTVQSVGCSMRARGIPYSREVILIHCAAVVDLVSRTWIIYIKLELEILRELAMTSMHRKIPHCIHTVLILYIYYIFYYLY